MERYRRRRKVPGDEDNKDEHEMRMMLRGMLRIRKDWMVDVDADADE